MKPYKKINNSKIDIKVISVKHRELTIAILMKWNNERFQDEYIESN